MDGVSVIFSRESREKLVKVEKAYQHLFLMIVL